MSSTPFAASARRLAAWAIGAVLCALAWGAPPAAEAAPNCTATVTSGDFGVVDVLTGGTVDITTTLNFACTGMVPVVPVTLCPNLGAGSGGDDGAGGRLLAGPSGATLPFQVFQGGYTQVWGSTALLAFGATPTITIIPNLGGAASTNVTMYARVTAQSTARPGTYTSSFANQGFFWGLNLLTCAGVTIGNFITPPTFSFTARVDPDCRVTANTLAFGTAGVLSTAKTAQNQINVRCTATTPYTLGLNNGLNGSGPTARKLAFGTGRITYGIYKDNGRTLPWGDVAQGLSAVHSGTGDGTLQSYDGYGLAPAQSTPAPGTYNDTIIATATY